MVGKHAAPSADGDETATTADAADADATPGVTGVPEVTTPDVGAPDTAPQENALRIVAGNPNATEIAAVTAVLTGVLEELAGELGRTAPTGPSAWQKSQRDIRKPLSPGAGNWRGFSG